MGAFRTHWIRLRTFSYPTEELDKVLGALLFATGWEDVDLEGRLEVDVLEGHHGQDVHRLDGTITKQREGREFLTRILAQDADRVLAELDRRTDDDGVVYLRIDKQAAAQGELRLEQVDDAIVVRVKPEVHPASREGAIAAMASFLSTLGP